MLQKPDDLQFLNSQWQDDFHKNSYIHSFCQILIEIMLDLNCEIMFFGEVGTFIFGVKNWNFQLHQLLKLFKD
jgi:hypothetical protein